MELDNVALQKKLRVHFQAQLECLPSLIAVPQGKGHHKAALVLFDWQQRAPSDIPRPRRRRRAYALAGHYGHWSRPGHTGLRVCCPMLPERIAGLLKRGLRCLSKVQGSQDPQPLCNRCLNMCRWIGWPDALLDDCRTSRSPTFGRITAPHPVRFAQWMQTISVRPPYPPSS